MVDVAQLQSIGKTAKAFAEQALEKTSKPNEIAPDLACVQLPIVNLFFFGERNAKDLSWTMVDAGLPFFEDRILRAAEERYGSGSRPSAIILTHGHFDHVGALSFLAKRWDAPIYAHTLEFPYLTGKASYPPPDPAVGGGAMSFMSRFFPRGPIDVSNRLHPLPQDGTVPGMPGWRWIHTPGHTPGHVSLFRVTDGALIAGDAFVTTKQESAFDALFMHRQRVRRPPAYYTPNWELARRSVVALAELRPVIAATGHGVPMRGNELREELDALVRDWDRIAVPAHGRYIHEPAKTDDHGVLSLPPAVYDPQLIKVAAIGVAALAGWLLLRRRSAAKAKIAAKNMVSLAGGDTAVNVEGLPRYKVRCG